MLIRLLFVLVLLIAVFWLWRRFAVRPSQRPGENAAAKTQPLLRCEQCDLHVTPANAVHNRAGLIFCSEAHRQQFEDA